MSTRRLVLAAWLLFALGTVLGWAFRVPIARLYVDCIGVIPVRLLLVNPVEHVLASLRLGLGVGLLSCSPVVGMLIAGPTRTWRMGVVFLILAVGGSLGSAWLVILEFRQLLGAEAWPDGLSPLYSTATLGRIFLIGPVVVWVVAVAVRAGWFGRIRKGSGAATVSAQGRL